jgi:hypothetical protein
MPSSKSRSRSKSKDRGGAKKDTMPEGLANALTFFMNDNQTQHKLLVDLCSKELGQTHLFEEWNKSDKVSPSVLRQMGDQLEQLDKAYPGGLRDYILKAKKLLEGVSRDFYSLVWPRVCFCVRNTTLTALPSSIKNIYRQQNRSQPTGWLDTQYPQRRII